MQAVQRPDDSRPISLVIPEEILALGQFLVTCPCRIDLLARIGMDSGIIDFCGHGHWRRGKVLHLLQMEIHLFCFHCQFRHIGFMAAGMRGDEVGDKLLFQPVRAVGAVEYFLNSWKSENGGLRMIFSTASEVCSGATFRRPDT